jgi:uncharacterized membrane protein YfcA
VSTTIGHVLFPLGLFLIAALYASVGQAGGTGYIALMGLGGFSPEVIKPTALALNVLVALLATVRFARARVLTWRSYYPFAILGAPFSVLGGTVHLPAAIYAPIVGGLLLLAAVLTIRAAPRPENPDRVLAPPFVPSLLAGASMGFVSGVTGVGGGIFLAPLVLALGWATMRQTAAISAIFNLLNSAFALVGTLAIHHAMPAALPWWLLAVGLGGLVGSWLAVHKAPPSALRHVLAALLIAAGVRLLIR